MVDGLGAGGWGGNVVPFPVLAPEQTRATVGEEVAPVDGQSTARGPQRRDRSPQASLHAVAAARTASEVAAAQFLHGLGPSGMSSLPTVRR